MGDLYSDTNEVRALMIAHEILTRTAISNRMEWADVSEGVITDLKLIVFYLIKPRPIPVELEVRMAQTMRRWIQQSA